ncbi:MAG: hypothetical protein II604_06950, partial [Bacteroidales bacterium]|nr:hypothetical protein [Bacteroidales bacterium]
MKKLVMLLCAVVISIFSYSQQPPCQDFTVVPDINARWNEEENRYEACADSYITLSAHGVFPNNDAPNGYHQSDENLIYCWSWYAEDGFQGANNVYSVGTTFAHGGYYIMLQATDQNGCRYVYPEPIVLVVSAPPTFEGTAVTPEICPGEAALLDGRVQPPDPWEMEIPEQIVEQHCFVDETGYVQSMCFEHNAFAPGQLIQSANDIESIAIDMEHSYLGDLEVWITCPSGNRLTLFDGYNGGSDLQFLGEPIDDDYDPCNPGTPYHYTWSHNATSTIEQVANNAPTYSYTDNAGNHYYGEEYIPAGDYRPTGDWSSLVGCPVNGEWCINIQDHRHWDDGVVFSVELHFADYLIPIESLIRFQTEFASSDMTWDGGNIIGGVAANTTALPNVPGQHEYVFSATDNFGCTYDTTLVVTVRDYDDPRCCITPSTTILTSTGNVCSNRTSLSARPLANGNTGEWSVVAYPNGDNVNNSVTFTSPNAPNTQVVVNGWGTYTFRWIEHYMGLADCIDFADVAITFNQQPNANFTYTPISCFGGETSIAYTGNMSADAEFSWNFDGGFV